MEALLTLLIIVPIGAGGGVLVGYGIDACVKRLRGR